MFEESSVTDAKIISTIPPVEKKPLITSQQPDFEGSPLTEIESTRDKPIESNEFGFSKEDWTKIVELDSVLDNVDILDQDLAEVIRDQVPFRRKKLDKVLMEIDTIRQEKKIFDAIVNNTQTEGGHKFTEFTEKIVSLKQQVEEKIQQDINVYLQSLPLYRRLPVQLSRDRSKVYAEENPLNHPLKKFVESLDLSVYKIAESLGELDLTQLVEVKAQMGQDLLVLPEHISGLIESCKKIFESHGLPENVREFFAENLRTHIEMNNGLSYRKNDIEREIIARKHVLQSKESSSQKELIGEITQITDFFDPLIKPKFNRPMPECIWWTQEVLDLFVYSHGQMSKLNGELEPQSRLHIVFKNGLHSIEQKIKDIYFLRVVESKSLDLGRSKDVVYHSASSLDDLLSILIDGKLLSLGSLRRENPTLERATDNKGGGKRFEQEQHQIYFNNLGVDETYPKGYTRDPYSPLSVSTKVIKNDPEAMELLTDEVKAVRESRKKAIERRKKYKIKEYSDRSRFCHLTTGLDDPNCGISDDPGSFFIASGFFFMKRDILKDRQFLQDDGIAVFDSDFMSVDDDRYFGIDWQQEGCFVTDKIGWAVVKNALIQELTTKGYDERQIDEKLAEVEKTLVLVPNGSWGGSFSNNLNVFNNPNPSSIIMPDGEVVDPDELRFLSNYQYLDQEDIDRKHELIEEKRGIVLLNKAYDAAYEPARQLVLQHLQARKSKSEVSPNTKIVPTIKEGDLPNAAGSPTGSIYRIISL